MAVGRGPLAAGGGLPWYNRHNGWSGTECSISKNKIPKFSGERAQPPTHTQPPPRRLHDISTCPSPRLRNPRYADDCKVKLCHMCLRHIPERFFLEHSPGYYYLNVKKFAKRLLTLFITLTLTLKAAPHEPTRRPIASARPDGPSDRLVRRGLNSP